MYLKIMSTDYEYDYILVVKDGQYGCKDLNGNVIAEALYDEIKYCRDIFQLKYFIVKRNGKYGIILTNGFIQVPCVYDKIYSHKCFASIVEIGGKKGLVYNGQEILPCTYDKISDEGMYYIVEKDGKRGVCDSTCAVILPCVYDEIKIETHYEINFPEEFMWPNAPVQNDIPSELITSNSLICFQKDGKWGCINGNIRKQSPCLTISNTSIVMKELVENIKALAEQVLENATAQAEKGNKAAGARARKASLELEKALKQFRKDSVEAAK